MARTAKRPKTLTIGSKVKARPIRGPHKDGSGRWYWRAELYDPNTQQRSTVWSGWALSAEAESAVAALVASGNPQTRPLTPSAVVTVRDLLECWTWHFENVGGRKGPLKESSKNIYRYAARHLLTHLESARVDRLTCPTVEGYRDSRLGSGVAPETVKSEIRVLGQAFRWWADRSPTPLPPFPRVAVKSRAVRNRYTPNRGEVLKVLALLDGWCRIAALLLYGTGARPAEIRDLEWDSINFDRAEVLLDGKTGPRTVPLARDVANALRTWRDAQSGQPQGTILGVTPGSFNTTFGPRTLRRACAAAGVPIFTPYGLRRAAVDAMARAGVDIGTAAAITGHSPEVMLRKYRTVSAEDQRRAIEVAGLGSLGSPRVLAFKRG